MASGQVFQVVPVPPAATAATLTTIAGTSTPAETVPVHAFDDTTAEHMDFYGCAQGYGASGFTVGLKTGGAAATGNYIFSAAFRRVEDDGEDLDTTAFTYDFNNSAAIVAPSAIGEVGYDTITFTNGVDSDSVADGEMFILRVKRLAADAGDTMTGDAFLHWPALVVRET